MTSRQKTTFSKFNMNIVKILSMHILMHNYYNKTSQEVFELVFDAKKFEVVNQGSANRYILSI